MAKVLNKHRDVISDNAVYIGRGSKYGNPFIIGKDGSREEVIEKYEKYADDKFAVSDIVTLIDRDLVCFCSPEKCHGDYLLRLADNLKQVLQSGPERGRSI